MLLPPAAHPRRQEILNFFRTRQENAGRENIEVTLLDPRQKAAIGPDQSPERSAAVSIHAVNQRGAFAIKVPRAIGFEFEQRSNLRSERARKLQLGNSKAFEVFRRKIGAPHIEIAVDIANDVGQLKCETQAFG